MQLVAGLEHRDEMQRRRRTVDDIGSLWGQSRYVFINIHLVVALQHVVGRFTSVPTPAFYYKRFGPFTHGKPVSFVRRTPPPSSSDI